MSLINQMLQDLDARRAVDAKAELPNHVYALPREKPSVLPKVALGGIALLVLGAGIFWMLQLPSATLKRNHSLPIPASVPAQAVVSPQVTSPNEREALRPATAQLQASSSLPAGTDKNDVSEADRSSPVVPAASPAPVEERSVLPRLSQTDVKKGKSIHDSNGALQEPRPREPAPGKVPARTRLASAPSAVVSPQADRSSPNAATMVIEKHLRLTTANQRAENEYSKALGVLNQGRINEAISGLYTALQEDPAHSIARQALAAILIEQRRMDEARIVLQKGLAQNSAQPVIAMKLARIEVERNDLNAARQTLERSGGSATGNADYRAFYAGVLQRLNEHSAAINEYQAALRLAPEAGAWWMGLGISLEAEGRMVEARDAFQRARAGGSLSTDLDHFVEQKLRQLQ